MRSVKGRKRGLKKKIGCLRLWNGSPTLPIARWWRYIHIYIDVYIIYIKKFSVSSASTHWLCIAPWENTASSFVPFFFVNFFFKSFFFSHVQGHFSRFVFFCVCVCVYGQSKLTRVKVKNDLDLLRSKRQVNLSTSRFFLFCLHDVHPYGNHTRLYSFKLSCKMVSLTAANTKRIFSVSEK